MEEYEPMNQEMAKLAEVKEWYSEALGRRVNKSLEKNNLTGLYVKTKEEDLEKMLSLIPEGSKVGYGEALSLDQMGIKDILRKGNYNLIDGDVHALGEDAAHIKRT